MNIVNVMNQCTEFLDKATSELKCGNEFCAEQQLMQLREYLNDQPELEAGGSNTERRKPE